MSYRGEDLDLRTPGARVPRDAYPLEASQNGPRARQNGSSRSEPTYVDDTVMACCNHAFDIAQAHGAVEVRLEHLIHALTRVESAAQVLEDRGVREAHLRRESAAVLASQIPVGLGNTQGAPRASSELDDVLRRAADVASRNGGVAGVEEVLWVMLNTYRDHPAVQLLARHAPDWQQWDWGYRGDVRREAPRTAVANYYPERRGSSYLEPRLRSDTAASYAGPSPSYDVTRFETMQSDAVGERRALSELVRELQRDIKATRVDPALLERVEAVERALEGRMQDLTRTATTLGDRLQAIEKSLTGGLQETSRGWTKIGDRLTALEQLANGSEFGDLVTEQLVSVSDKIAQLERAMTTQTGGTGLQTMLNERFQALRQTVDQQNLGLTSAIAQLTEPVNERMRQVEQSITRGQSEASQLWRALADRLGQTEAAVQSQNDKALAQSQRDRGEVAEALVKLGSNQQVLAENLDSWRADQAGNVSIVANRIDQLEALVGQPLQLLQQMQADLQGLQQVTLADYDRNRRGFRHWLFGTEDVFARSWRDETRQVRDRLQQLARGGSGRA